MNFDSHIKNVNSTLFEKQPLIINASWIYNNNPKAYRYFWKNTKTEIGSIDWDKVTSNLDRSFQKRWTRYKYKKVKPYECQSEVDVILDKYRDKLYTFITQADERDKKIQHRMIISLVRIGQKGNVCAQQELVKWVTYITDDWVDRYPKMYRWNGYTDEIEDKIKNCIRLYRYTGSFLGYLFKTLEYSARGKPLLCSLNDKMFDGDKTREEFAIVEDDWQIYK